MPLTRPRYAGASYTCARARTWSAFSRSSKTCVCVYRPNKAFYEHHPTRGPWKPYPLRHRAHDKAGPSRFGRRRRAARRGSVRRFDVMTKQSIGCRHGTGRLAVRPVLHVVVDGDASPSFVRLAGEHLAVRVYI